MLCSETLWWWHGVTLMLWVSDRPFPPTGNSQLVNQPVLFPPVLNRITAVVDASSTDGVAQCTKEVNGAGTMFRSHWFACRLLFSFADIWLIYCLLLRETNHVPNDVITKRYLLAVVVEACTMGRDLRCVSVSACVLSCAGAGLRLVTVSCLKSWNRIRSSLWPRKEIKLFRKWRNKLEHGWSDGRNNENTACWTIVVERVSQCQPSWDSVSVTFSL